MAASGVSFQGVSTGLKTDALISAVIDQDSQPMVRMQNRQAANNQKSLALTALKTDLMNLSTAVGSLTTGGFDGRTVTSSDPANSSVSATASGAAPGVYDVSVTNLATRARLVIPPVNTTPAADGSPAAPQGVDPAAPVGTGTYTLTDTNGARASVTIDGTNNTLSGLQNAINNAKDSNGKALLDLKATVIQTGAGSQLVINAKDTGTGKDGAGTFSLSYDPDVFSAASPLVNGSLSSTQAVNAHFTLDGVAMERNSNKISDALNGVTLNLISADPSKNTTLSVGLNTASITTAMQGVVSAYNQLHKDYATRATSTTAPDGTITNGVFANDPGIYGMIQGVHDALMGAKAFSPAFGGVSGVGLSTNKDGTLSLNTTAFASALAQDADGVQGLFSTSGTSSSPSLTYLGSTASTSTAPIDVSISQPDPLTGLVTGTFSTTPSGRTTPFTTTLSPDANGKYHGTYGTPLEGLSVQAPPGTTGTIKVTQGIAQNLMGLVQTLNSPDAGNIGNMLQNLQSDNSRLNNQIGNQQSKLARQKTILEKNYSNLETTIGKLQAAGQSITNM